MSDQPFFPAGVKGARALRGTIMGAVRAGQSLATLLSQVQDFYAQQGYELRQATRAAIERQYQTFTEQESKSRSLQHVPGPTALTSQWISYSGLERTLQQYNANPRLMVRGKATGTVAGLQLTKWVTFIYEGPGARGLTVGDLRSDVSQYFRNRNYPEMASAEDVALSEVAVSAI